MAVGRIEVGRIVDGIEEGVVVGLAVGLSVMQLPNWT
jgi:hypothetical protein